MTWHNFGNTFYFGFDSFFNTPWTRASQVALVVKNLPACAGDARDTSLIPGPEDPLGKGMATHSNILAWKIPQTEEPGGLQSTGLQRVGHD